MRSLLVVAVLMACGDGTRMEPQPDVDAAPIVDVASTTDAYLGTLLGHSCPLPMAPILDQCSAGPVDDLAYCVDGGAGDGVCRPSCYYKGTTTSRCAAMHGTEQLFRGACVCVPE